MPPAGGVRTSLSYTLTDGRAWGAFSPGIPIKPVVNQPIRGWDFPVNVNSNPRPRAYEPFGFPALRAFSNVELVRMAIETRKDQIDRLDWQVKAKDNKKGVSSSKIDDITAFLRRPNPRQTLHGLLRGVMEDLLSIDAPAMEKRRNRGGKLIGLECVPGDTIVPLVDETGRSPLNPSIPAYQQWIKGTVWSDLTCRDLLYLPRNVRPNHVYGFGPVEQIVVSINTIIRRQAAQLSYFTESNVPKGMLTAPAGWDLAKIKDLQDWFNDKISGNAAEQARLVFGPDGTKYQQFKDAPIKDEFDEWLARIVAFAFSLPPTPFVRQMNKGTANEDQDRALEEGLEPVKLWNKRWIDDLIEFEFDAPELEFVFLDTPSIDPNLQAQIDDKNLRNLSATIDEVRDARGDDPLPNGMGKLPLVLTSSGAMTLEQVLKQAEQAVAGQGIEEPAVPTHVGDPAAPVAPVAPAPPAAPPVPKAPTTKLAKGKVNLTPTRPKCRRAIASASKAMMPIFSRAADAIAADVAKALKALGKDKSADDMTPAAVATGIAKSIDLSVLKGLGDAINDDLLDIFADTADAALKSISVPVTDDLTNQVFQRAVDYAEERGAELVALAGDESVVEVTRDLIRTTIADGLRDNIGADAIADAIQESTAFSSDRADLIAKTEIAKANGAGKGEGWQAAKATGLIIKKSWSTGGDGDTCEDCLGNEAQGEIDVDETFASGDDYEPAHPRCQCSVSATATDPDDDEDPAGDGE